MNLTEIRKVINDPNSSLREINNLVYSKVLKSADGSTQKIAKEILSDYEKVIEKKIRKYTHEFIHGGLLTVISHLFQRLFSLIDFFGFTDPAALNYAMIYLEKLKKLAPKDDGSENIVENVDNKDTSEKKEIDPNNNSEIGDNDKNEEVIDNINVSNNNESVTNNNDNNIKNTDEEKGSGDKQEIENHEKDHQSEDTEEKIEAIRPDQKDEQNIISKNEEVFNTSEIDAPPFEGGAPPIAFFNPTMKPKEKPEYRFREEPEPVEANATLEKKQKYIDDMINLCNKMKVLNSLIAETDSIIKGNQEDISSLKSLLDNCNEQIRLLSEAKKNNKDEIILIAYCDKGKLIEDNKTIVYASSNQYKYYKNKLDVNKMLLIREIDEWIGIYSRRAKALTNEIKEAHDIIEKAEIMKMTYEIMLGGYYVENEKKLKDLSNDTKGNGFLHDCIDSLADIVTPIPSEKNNKKELIVTKCKTEEAIKADMIEVNQAIKNLLIDNKDDKDEIKTRLEELRKGLHLKKFDTEIKSLFNKKVNWLQTLQPKNKEKIKKTDNKVQEKKKVDLEGVSKEALEIINSQHSLKFMTGLKLSFRETRIVDKNDPNSKDIEGF